MHTPWTEIVIGLSVATGSAIIIFIGRLLVVSCKNAQRFFAKVQDAIITLSEIKKAVGLIQEDSKELFINDLVILESMEHGEFNGNVTDRRRKFEQYYMHR